MAFGARYRTRGPHATGLVSFRRLAVGLGLRFWRLIRAAHPSREKRGMTPNVTRREFLTLAAGATALGLGAGSCSSGSPESADAQTGSVLPRPADVPFDTVVVLMMENRSFDHLLGWLPGANGRQQGLSYVDKDGVAHETWPLAPDFQGCL